MLESPLEARLSRHLALTFSERDALRWLERRERAFRAGEVVVHEGAATDSLYVVASGWLHGSVRLKDGGRQILRFYFVGDITTTFSIARGHSAATLRAMSDTTLFEMPKSAFGRLFRDYPRLGALLFDGLVGATFELPLTQQDLGDAVGLTKTHVSRSLKALEETGLVERNARVIRINDVDRLADLVGFNDRHGHIATDWLPAVGMRDDAPRGGDGDMDHRETRAREHMQRHRPFLFFSSRIRGVLVLTTG